jgi:phage gpG-like protein
MIGILLRDNAGPSLAGFEGRARERLGAAMTRLGAALEGRVQDNLDGAVLARRSGRLAAAQTTRVAADGDAVSVSVGFDPGQVPYGAIQEFGGTTRAHLIAAKSAFALAFTVGDRLVFAKRVNHPGSRIPQRSFLRSALAGFAPDAAGTVGDTMIGAIRS